MRQKNSTYLLILLAIGVWGIVGFQIFKRMQGSLKVVRPNVHSVKLKAPPKKDTFSLNLDYPSPFLIGQRIQKKQKITFLSSLKESRQRRNILKEIEKEDNVDSNQIIWPQIKYLGLGKHGSSHSQTVLLSINNDIQMMDVHDVVDDLYILYAHEDSIKINYNGQIKTFFTR